LAWPKYPFPRQMRGVAIVVILLAQRISICRYSLSAERYVGSVTNRLRARSGSCRVGAANFMHVNLFLLDPAFDRWTRFIPMERHDGVSKKHLVPRGQLTADCWASQPHGLGGSNDWVLYP